jgi:hypothetical protein
LHELFLRSTYFPLAGAALEFAYIDFPEAVPMGRGAESRRCLVDLGVQCDINLKGAAAAVRALFSSGCEDKATYARLYAAIANLDEDGTAIKMNGGNVEEILRSSIFHPEHKKPLAATSCVWAAPPGPILPHCFAQLQEPLRDVYSEFGEKRLENYFASRGVPASVSSAAAYIHGLNVLFHAAEDLGRKWRTSSRPEGVSVACGRSALRAEIFLANVWQALVDIYKGMAGLSDYEREALRPFSSAEARVIVPLRCPGGGPVAEMSMLDVARFHDGAIFRRLPAGEAFWEVAMDLAHSPVAEWAIGSFFPSDLRGLFVDDFGIRPVVDGEGLRDMALKARKRKSTSNARGMAGGFASEGSIDGFQSVNASGLPSDLFASLHGDETRGSASILDAAAAAVESLKGRSSRVEQGRRRSSAEPPPPLVSAAVPAHSVRCPATRAQRLVHGGSISIGSGAVSIYVAEDAEAANLSDAGKRSVEKNRRKMTFLAALLWQMAEDVFGIPGEHFALVLDGSVRQEGCGHQHRNTSWPLLFSANLQDEVGDDATFWFAEFCHALAHFAEGPDYSSRHARVSQALLARHFAAFSNVFRPSAGKRSKSRSHKRPRGRSRKRSRSHSRKRSKSRSRKRSRRTE